jgi:hypothetical protein
MLAETLGGRLLAEVQEEWLDEVSLPKLERSKCSKFPLRPFCCDVLTDHDIGVE